MQITLFGGSFDPPHLGHFQVTENLLSRKIADEVWYVPVKQHHFAKKMLPAQQRLEMLQLMVAAHSPEFQPRIRIETYELHQTGINYSFDTLENLSAQYSQHTFSFVIGSDNLPSFYKWTAVHPMLLKYCFYVYPRQGFPMSPLYEGMVALTDFPQVGVSSTLIRERRCNHQQISDLVVSDVDKYIKDHQLYEAPS